MLTKRTQILLDQRLWRTLFTLASKEKTSVGELLRQAAKEKYLDQAGDLEKAKRKAVYQAIMRIRPMPVKGNIDYKELINYGRKY